MCPSDFLQPKQCADSSEFTYPSGSVEPKYPYGFLESKGPSLYYSLSVVSVH